MAPGALLPWFKVTILHNGEKLIAYDIRATDAGDAKDEAWRRYEFSKGRPGFRLDKAFDTQIEEILIAPRP
jgi:hypothetical protein